MAYRQQKITGTMPHHAHQDDAKWINEMLNNLNAIERAQVCRAYSDVYLQSRNSVDVEHKKNNVARYNANTRLRMYIAKRNS